MRALDSDKDSYDSNHHELNIKNTIVKNLKVEINKLQQDIKEIDTYDKKTKVKPKKKTKKDQNEEELIYCNSGSSNDSDHHINK